MNGTLADDINGVKINRIRTGPRNTSSVVLIHGVGYDLTYWDRQIEALRISTSLRSTCRGMAVRAADRRNIPLAGFAPSWRPLSAKSDRDPCIWSAFHSGE